mmetsp:Transcript_122075/g.390437  ORF Transcript_122075/g.390437 Transcript_122075/m.390437 type:complete len:284 (+) Transcript_122075:700-1551(+)
MRMHRNGGAPVVAEVPGVDAESASIRVEHVLNTKPVHQAVHKHPRGCVHFQEQLELEVLQSVTDRPLRHLGFVLGGLRLGEVRQHTEVPEVLGLLLQLGVVFVLLQAPHDEQKLDRPILAHRAIHHGLVQVLEPSLPNGHPFLCICRALRRHDDHQVAARQRARVACSLGRRLGGAGNGRLSGLGGAGDGRLGVLGRRRLSGASVSAEAAEGPGSAASVPDEDASRRGNWRRGQNSASQKQHQRHRSQTPRSFATPSASSYIGWETHEWRTSGGREMSSRNAQ